MVSFASTIMKKIVTFATGFQARFAVLLFDQRLVVVVHLNLLQLIYNFF